MLVASSALADPDADAEADRLFNEGRALMKDGRFDEACPKLERSQRLSPHGGVLLNVAACHERIGKIATAWVEFHDALTAARADGKDDRARLAEERIAALEPRVPWIVVRVPDDAREGVQVTLDGAVLSSVAWGKDMPVDPGDHRVVATRPGAQPFERAFHLDEGARREITIDATPPIAQTPAPPPPIEPRHDDRPAARVEPPSDETKRRTVFEVGLFGGATTGGFAKPSDTELQKIATYDTNGYATTCASYTCAIQSDTMVTAGATAFVGYAATPRFHVGLRGMAGLHLSGGFLAAIGPSMSGRILGPFWVGWSFFVGDLAERVKVTPSANPHSNAALGTPELTAWDSSGITAGNGIELGVAIHETKSSALMIQMLPTIMITPRSLAVTIPVGLSYRFF